MDSSLLIPDLVQWIALKVHVTVTYFSYTDQFQAAVSALHMQWN